MKTALIQIGKAAAIYAAAFIAGLVPVGLIHLLCFILWSVPASSAGIVTGYFFGCIFALVCAFSALVAFVDSRKPLN